MRNLIRGITAALLLTMLPLGGNAALFVSVTIAPPALPVYVAPPMPAPGYFWTPGYWAYADTGYYWVPGTWVLAPAPGLLWTPGYWGWVGGAYVWNAGYWGPHVGFYGGVDYGFGYGGHGFNGGVWQGGRFVANTTVINNTTIVNNTTVNRVSFNGGAGGVVASPTAAEAHAAQEHHVGPSEVQQQHQLAASRDMTMRASYNHGSPSVAATAKAGVFYGKGVVAASRAGGAPGHPAAAPQAMMHAQAGGHGSAGAPGQSHGRYPGGTPPQAHGAYPGGAPGSAHAVQPHGAGSGAQHGAPGNARPPQGHGGEHQEPGRA
jgi:WXXGXW repeat (2 copies)